MRTSFLGFSLVLIAGFVGAQEVEKEKPLAGGAREKFAAITARYAEATNAFFAKLQSLATDAEKQKYYEESFPKPDAAGAELLALANEDPRGDVAFDCIGWILQNRVQGAPRAGALGLLTTHHLDNPQAASLFGNFAYDPDPSIEDVLATFMAKSTQRQLKGIAHFQLAQHLLGRVEMSRMLAGASPADRERAKSFFGEKTLTALAKVDVKKSEARATDLLERVKAEYAELSFGPGTLGELAKSSLFELENLSVGKVAPEIEGEDIFGQKFKLSEYRGKIIFLDFWGHW